jgi:hypothetical protein
LSESLLRRPAVLVATALGAAGLASWAALTVPFSAGADAVTALAIALGAGVAATQWRTMTAPLPATTGAAWWPWLAVAALVVAWELVCLFLGPRVDHPTLSSLYDAATAHAPAVKGLFFLAWLWLGALLVRR